MGQNSHRSTRCEFNAIKRCNVTFFVNNIISSANEAWESNVSAKVHFDGISFAVSFVCDQQSCSSDRNILRTKLTYFSDSFTRADVSP